MQLPILPEQLPSLERSSPNENFTTYWEGDYNFIEKPGLMSFTLASWLPSKTYGFQKAANKPQEYINLINNAMNNAEPIQILIISSDGSTYVNDFFSVDSFKYNIDRLGDYIYSLDVKQWREYKTNITKNFTVGWNQNSTGWWYYTDSAGNYYKDSWQLIDGEWYSFNSEGYAKANEWELYKGVWYYLKSNCKMAKGEWLQINGKWYCFDSKGEMYANDTTPDGYKVDSNGAWTG
ncbi:cell wall-binding protein [Clostridium butyricum]|uniref:cell wall-binding protein n=1 Tax=Clostridium butyricum TaxID=1492 RepID=UPI002ABD82DA|nr:cell wall-binding protein [Clostridium butyricum]